MIRHICALAALVLSTSTLACTAPTGDDEVAETNQDLVSRSASFEVQEGSDGQFYFSMIAGNGEKLLRSEGYVSRSNAARGIEALLDAGLSRAAYVVTEAKNGQFYFNVKSGNGQVVATSELYATKYNAQRATETVRTLIVKANRLDSATE